MTALTRPVRRVVARERRNLVVTLFPGDAAEIASFCRLSHDVSFPMFAKIEVNGPGTHPLYRHLKQAAPGLLGSKAVKWNFTKFLVRKNGEVYKRYAPTTKPSDLVADIENLLAE